MPNTTKSVLSHLYLLPSVCMSPHSGDFQTVCFTKTVINCCPAHRGRLKETSEECASNLRGLVCSWINQANHPGDLAKCTELLLCIVTGQTDTDIFFSSSLLDMAGYAQRGVSVLRDLGLLSVELWLRETATRSCSKSQMRPRDELQTPPRASWQIFRLVASKLEEIHTRILELDTVCVH